jgi:hypothetical protein
MSLLRSSRTVLAIPIIAFSLSAQADSLNCIKYKDFGASLFSNDPKAGATDILNGALFRLDDQISAAEIDERDSCIEKAIADGADVNNTSGSFLPLVKAVQNRDEREVHALLAAHADANATDKVLGEPSGTGRTVLQIACSNLSEQIVLDLVRAGADPVKGEPLWSAAAGAMDQAVEALLNTGKIPVNQLATFGQAADPNFSQTALDASVEREDQLAKYFSTFAQNKNAKEKIDYVNFTIFYAEYIFAPRLVAGKDDPDMVMKSYQRRQSHVTALLKAKGWTCYQDNCGVLRY